ncbi:glycoside hydrolase family 73 protein [Streptomyces rishiriensis]|uniref:glycoside hydrolase family 73 protein n=1 Tax=Streptomyces rishiriensis TaxID=68264 RepID=UPI00131F3BB8|nr:glucosaminidase domain-containing protein [Streptomyces rishiriensis]
MTLTQAQQQFLSDAVSAGRASQAEFQVPASVTIAQAILESGWGAKHMGNANNYFGIKAQTRNGQVTWGSIATGYVTVPTREVINGQSVTVQANFRSYNSMTDSFRDHGAFLRNNSNYAPAFKTSDGIAFARAVAAGHYATDPHYADALVRIIQQQNLLQYDSAAANAGTPQSGGADAGTDAGVDAGTDAGVDAGTDAGTDAGVDTGIDAGADAGTDAGVDAGADTGVDAGTDVGVDAGADTGTDIGVEAGTDTGTDTGVDAGAGTGVDTGTDLGTDTETDTGTGLGADTETDTGTDTEADAGADTETDPGVDTGTGIDTEAESEAEAGASA